MIEAAMVLAVAHDIEEFAAEQDSSSLARVVLGWSKTLRTVAWLDRRSDASPNGLGREQQHGTA